MIRRKRIVMVVLIVALLTSLAFVAFFRSEPTFHGKTVTSWLDDLIKPDPVGRLIEQDDARSALAAIGPKAAPYIIRRLKQTESRPHHFYQEVYGKFPSWLKTMFPVPSPDLNGLTAGNVLFAVGPPIKPQLIELLGDSSPSVREAAAFALGCLNHYDKTDIRDAIPALTKGLRDSYAMVRLHCANDLGFIGGESYPSVGDLITCLNDPETGSQPGSFVLRSCVARALGKIGPRAKEALPGLRSILEKNDGSEGNNYLRAVTAVAIWRIDGEVTNTLPVLIDELNTVPPGSTWEVIEGLDEMGPLAKDAVPVLIQYMDVKIPSWQRDYTFSYNCEKITNALKKIDPVVAAKIGVK